MNHSIIYSKPRDAYSDSYDAHAFEQYKMYLETTERIAVRRQSANSFFVTINTLIITLSGYMKSTTGSESFIYMTTSFAGILICYTWYRLILSYKNLNTAKFRIIHALELELPYRLYDAEWQALGEGKDKKTYHPFTQLEMRVPWFFLVIHLLVLLFVLPWKMLM